MKSFLQKKAALMIMVLVLLASGFTQTGQASGQNSDSLGELKGTYDFNSSEEITVMVQLDEPSITEAKHKGLAQSEANLKKNREQLKSDIAALIPDSEVEREYDHLFSGIALTLSEKEVLQLTELDGVQAIYPSVTYQATEFSPEKISSEEFSPEMMDSAPFIGADEAWESLGITGKGVTVAIIDTGVDYTHPDLAHAFGDYKGYDFVDNNDDPQEGEGQYHGTHVAGTVAANGNIKGVAPDASLLGYRVLGPQGGTTADVVAGIELAVKDGADVMNLSLGNTVNDPDWATSIALDWAMAEGVVAVTSNGNSGPNNWTVGSPGTSRDAISVGATQLPYNLYEADLFTSEDVEYPTAKVMGFNDDEELLALDGESYEFVDAELGRVGDFDGVDVEGKIALIKRGDIPFVEKAENAAAAGAVGAIIFNNGEGEIPFVIPGMAVPTLKLDDVDGQKMVDELKAGNNEVTFDIQFDREVGETVAEFSSRGPAYATWMIKPDVSAPGVDIVSTFPGESYASLQGTSMSAPHVAGAAALLLEKNPNWGTDKVKAALMNTAESIYDENGNVYPFNTQGAGSIRVVEALTAETLVSPGSHSFGVFDKEKGRQTERQHFEVMNLSEEGKRYSIDVDIYDGDKHIKVNTSNNLNVKAGGTQKVNMNVQVNAGVLEPGYYEGMITLSRGNEVIEVPTILFVMDPDYPHLSYGGITSVTEDGSIEFYMNLNRDVDYAEMYIFTAGFAPVAYVDTFGPLSQGDHDLTLDASGVYDNLDAGDYALVAFIGKGDVEEGYVIGNFTKE
ncbi:S8 family serine peptidase [Salipaludibacillus aurantiacus]|uniref:Minor extracellular serine protease Vpr n=1 Tax=Salipaludibacillus aurantiacus TaxID=1601833 RepID=A0A1H9WMF5_9BACI|nr:minor extracellular serine protease Vpr [Salipaludibacillus aurantiacus]